MPANLRPVENARDTGTLSRNPTGWTPEAVIPEPAREILFPRGEGAYGYFLFFRMTSPRLKIGP